MFLLEVVLWQVPVVLDSSTGFLDPGALSGGENNSVNAVSENRRFNRGASAFAGQSSPESSALVLAAAGQTDPKDSEIILAGAGETDPESAETAFAASEEADHPDSQARVHMGLQVRVQESLDRLS